jgi:hypothetical protein
VAVLMRADRSLRRVTLVINNRPCGPDQPRRNLDGSVKRNRDGSVAYRKRTCDEQLPAMQPARGALTIHVRHGGTLSRWKTYTGTGEGLIQP